jgi:hypothetical protein
LDLPSVTNAAAVNKAHAKLSEAVADGTLTPEEAQAVSGLLALHLKVIEATEFEQRLKAVEEQQQRRAMT